MKKDMKNLLRIILILKFLDYLERILRYTPTEI